MVTMRCAAHKDSYEGGSSNLTLTASSVHASVHASSNKSKHGLELWSKWRRVLAKQISRTPVYNDTKHLKWRNALLSEIGKLYQSLHAMEHQGLVDKKYENAEEGVFAVMCIIGDWTLAEKWLSLHAQTIRFDFELYNFCDGIEQWLKQLRSENDHEYQFLDYATTSHGMAACLLERVSAERLEGCTMVHCAAISGDVNMVRIISQLWNGLLGEQKAMTEAQCRRDGVVCSKEFKESWGTRNSLGEVPYDLIPSCEPVGKGGCQCSSSFNDIPCSSHSARKAMLSSEVHPVPFLFRGGFFAILVALIIFFASLYSDVGGKLWEETSLYAWGSVSVAYIILWTALGSSTFISNLWNNINRVILALDMHPLPEQKPSPSRSEFLAIRDRRKIMHTHRVIEKALVGDSSPCDCELARLTHVLSWEHELQDSPLLDKELVNKGRRLLIDIREAKQKAQEIEEMRTLANNLLSNLSSLETALKTDVEGDVVSEAISANAEASFIRALIFSKSSKHRDDGDVAKIERRTSKLKTLLKLRTKLSAALKDPDDDNFEGVVEECRQAKILESKAVRARLQAISQPRIALSQLFEACKAPTLDTNILQRAVNLATECLKAQPTSSAAVNLTECVEDAVELLNGLKSLGQAKTLGRKAHAQLLVSSDQHDTSHIGKLAKELDKFRQVCDRVRSDLPDPTNLSAVEELIEKWRREEGPSRDLKAAISGSSIQSLRAAITQAKEAGIGVKAAKKRLTSMEQYERNKEELSAALSAKDVARLRQAVSAASGCGLDTTSAREILREMTVKEACIHQLADALKSSDEKKIQKAITLAKEHGISTSDAQEKLTVMVEKRRVEALQKERDRDLRRQKLLEELSEILTDAQPSMMGALLEACRACHNFSTNIEDKVPLIQQRLEHILETIATSPERNIKSLSEALRSVRNFEALGISVDTSLAKEALDRWDKQSQARSELTQTMSLARKKVDEQLATKLEVQLASFRELAEPNDGTVAVAEKLLGRCKTLVQLRVALRNAKAKHDAHCSMPPLVEKPTMDVPGYIVKFKEDLRATEDKLSSAEVREMEGVVSHWESDAQLVFALRSATFNKDIDALNQAMKNAKKSTTPINLNPSRKALEKLQKQVEKQSIKENLQAALENKHDCAGLLAAIEAAKKFDIPTYDATATLVKWKNKARAILAKARASHNKDRLRDALEATAAMGLSHLPEWKESRRVVEGIAPSATVGTKAATSATTKVAVKPLQADRALHPRYKTEMCTHWLTHGTCSYGKERCNFAHGEADLRKPAAAAAAARAASNREAEARIAKTKSPSKQPEIPIRLPEERERVNSISSEPSNIENRLDVNSSPPISPWASLTTPEEPSLDNGFTNHSSHETEIEQLNTEFSAPWLSASPTGSSDAPGASIFSSPDFLPYNEDQNQSSAFDESFWSLADLNADAGYLPKTLNADVPVFSPTGDSPGKPLPKADWSMASFGTSGETATNGLPWANDGFRGFENRNANAFSFPDTGGHGSFPDSITASHSFGQPVNGMSNGISHHHTHRREPSAGEDDFLNGVFDTCLEEGFNEMAQNVCVECFTNPRSVTFTPCGHTSLCLDCARSASIRQCPLCSASVEGFRTA